MSRALGILWTCACLALGAGMASARSGTFRELRGMLPYEAASTTDVAVEDGDGDLDLIRAFAEGGAARLLRLEARELESIWR